ncbi:MAG: MobA/MobL family protein [Desulfuromonas sp.]|nr:MobA/MobL family protein [Desulfuromonas sp.]
MAIARLSVKVGKSGKASPHASYIAREGEYAKYTERGEKLEHKEHGNMPNWAQHDPQVFWKAADQYERKNGTTYREFEIALPREMTAEQRQGLVGDFVKQEIGNKYPYQFAIHNPKSLDGDEQPHVHLMFSERRLDGIDRDPDQHFKRYNAKHPERGGAQKDNTGKTAAVRKEELIALRSRWETMCNEHLEKHGHQDRIDMRSYKDQGLELEPTNLKISDWKNKEKRETALKTRAINKEVIASKRELEKTIPNLGRELKGFQKNRIAAIREQGAALRKDRPLTQAEIDRRAKFEARMAKINQPKENQKMTDNNQQQQDKFEPSGLTHEERLAQQDKDQKAQKQRDNIHKPDDKEQARRQANIEAGIAAGQRANERMDSERAKPQAIAQDFSKDSMAAQEWRGGIGTKSAEDKKIESEILNKQVELEIKMREQGRPVDSLQQVKDIEAKAKAEQQTEKQAEKVQPVEQEEQDSKQNDRLESERANVLERAHEERQNEQQPATQEASERTAPKQMSIQEMREQGRALRAEREAQKVNERGQDQER